MGAGIPLSKGTYIESQNPNDAKYFNDTQPWASVAEVLAGIPIGERHIGLIVNIDKVEYRFKEGIADADLVLRESGGISTQQAADITTNNAKVGITTQQAADILANNAKNLQEVLTAGNTYVVGNSAWTWNGDYFTILNSLAGGFYLSGDEGMVFTDNTGATDGYTVISGTGIQLGNGVNVSEIGCFDITQDREFNLPDADGTFALIDDITINSKIASEPTGSDAVLNVVSLTQAEYDAGTKIATTFYIITD